MVTGGPDVPPMRPWATPTKTILVDVDSELIFEPPGPTDCAHGVRVAFSPPGVVHLGQVALSKEGQIAAFRLSPAQPGTASVTVSKANHALGSFTAQVIYAPRP